MVRPSGYESSSGPTVPAAWAVYFLTSLALVGEGSVLQQHLMVAGLAGSFEDLERLVQVPVPFCVWLAWRFISRGFGMAFGLLGRLETSGSGLLFATSFGRVVSAWRDSQRRQGAFDGLVAEPCFLQHGPTGIVVPADRWSGRWGVKPQSKWDSTQRYPGWHPRSIGVPAMVAVLTPDRVKTSGPSLPDQSGSTTWAGGLRGWM